MGFTVICPNPSISRRKNGGSFPQGRIIPNLLYPLTIPRTCSHCWVTGASKSPQQRVQGLVKWNHRPGHQEQEHGGCCYRLLLIPKVLTLDFPQDFVVEEHTYLWDCGRHCEELVLTPGVLTLDFPQGLVAEMHTWLEEIEEMYLNVPELHR